MNKTLSDIDQKGGWGTDDDEKILNKTEWKRSNESKTNLKKEKKKFKGIQRPLIHHKSVHLRNHH